MALDALRQDLRIGARILTKDKPFAIISVAVLAIGICAVTTQFTVVNAVALRGLSFPQFKELMNVGLVDPMAPPQNNNFGKANVPSAEDYEELRATEHSFVAMAAYRLPAYVSGTTVNVGYHGTARRYAGGYVTEDLFRILGVSPVLGRDFTAADNKPGAEKVILLSYDAWKRDFAADAQVVGQTLRVNGRPATVIGVMPAGFKFPVDEEIWIPFYNEFPRVPRGDLATRSVAIMGRLKPGVTLSEANTEFMGLARRLAQAYPKTNARLVSATVQPLANNYIPPQLRRTVFAMLGAVVVVLLIACVNVMNMQLGRVTIRAKELAIRQALGATRWRLIRQILTETLILTCLSSALGVILACAAVFLVVRATQALPFRLPYWVTFSIDTPVLLFTIGTMLVATVLSGLTPAFIGARANLASRMKESGRGTTSVLANIVTRALVVGQIALTTALLIAALFQIWSIRNQTKVDYGYDENAIYTARIGLFEGDYPTSEMRQQFFIRALGALRTNSAFDGAALTDRFRMTYGDVARYEVEGQNYITDKDRPEGIVESVSDQYFAALGVKILQGRDFAFDEADSKKAVAIVNVSFAKKYFGNASPIGQRIRMYDPAQPPQTWRTIVGMVNDTLMSDPFSQRSDSSGFYLPILGVPPIPEFVTIAVRPHLGQSAESLSLPLAQAIAHLDPNLPTYFGGTPAQLHQETLGVNRLVAALFTIFGAVALALSAVGLYGVMTFSVTQRTQEFGIRIALGADAPKIMRLVLSQGAFQLILGLILGAATAVLAVTFIGRSALQSFLFRVDPFDPIIYCSVVGILTLVALASCFVPARRATRVNPIIALRVE
jgi:putative ABC transport system permease protein